MSGARWRSILQLLRGPTDDERMAGLLLVVSKDNGGPESEAQMFSEVLDALGFRFIKRLLGTASDTDKGKGKDTCILSEYQALGLSIASRMIWALQDLSKFSVDGLIEVECLCVEVLLKCPGSSDVHAAHIESSLRCLAATCFTEDSNMDMNMDIKTAAAEAGVVEAASRTLKILIESEGDISLQTLCVHLLWVFGRDTSDLPAVVAAADIAVSNLLLFLSQKKQKRNIEIEEYAVAYSALSLYIDLNLIIDMPIRKQVQKVVMQLLKSRAPEKLRVIGLDIASRLMRTIETPADCELIVRLASIEVGTALHTFKSKSKEEEGDEDKHKDKEKALLSGLKVLDNSLDLLMNIDIESDGDSLGGWNSIGPEGLLRIRHALVDAYRSILDFFGETESVDHPNVKIACAKSLGSFLAADTVSLVPYVLDDENLSGLMQCSPSCAKYLIPGFVGLIQDNEGTDVAVRLADAGIYHVLVPLILEDSVNGNGNVEVVVELALLAELVHEHVVRDEKKNLIAYLNSIIQAQMDEDQPQYILAAYILLELGHLELKDVRNISEMKMDMRQDGWECRARQWIADRI